jgi:hypothetical protein
MEVPLVIAHFAGNPRYLAVCLQSAARFNRSVVLIGDATNEHSWKDHWNSDRADLPKFRQFMRSYVKMSDYPDVYEASFWKRPFAVEAWMQSARIPELFLIDSDVLTFADYSGDLASLLHHNCLATLMAAREQGPYDWWHSLHFSYWTREAMEDFTNFCIFAYADGSVRAKLEEKYRWHIENCKPGGVCEMTLLDFWEKRNPNSVLNLARVTNDSAADIGIGMSTNYFADEYEMNGGFKKLWFRNGIPFGFNKILQRPIKFWCLHCQGGSKAVMRFLYNERFRPFFPQLYRYTRIIQALKRRSEAFPRKVVRRLARRSTAA